MGDARRAVIVGAGLAGFRAARALRDGGFAGSVVLVGDEPHYPYDRPPLSKQLLAGTFTAEDCRLAGEVDDIDWRLGSAASSVSTDDRRLVVTDGSELEYDELVIATGRRARPWPGPLPLSGVHTLRTVDDVAGLLAAVRPGTRVVIIGAGFIGCEVAATLRARDVDVTVTSVDPYPMPVMGPEVGARSRDLHEKHGVHWVLGRSVQAIEGNEAVTGVRLDSDELLLADVVLVAIGSVPNSEWLAGTGLSLTGGVVQVDTACRALDLGGEAVPGVWATGDIASWKHRDAQASVCIEHWSNARDMADVVAHNIIGDEERHIASIPAFWSDQYDVKFKSVGYLRGADELVVIEDDPQRNAMLVEARRGGVVIGAIGLNRNKAILGYQRTLRAASAVADG
ncbi:hypothetical protein A5742_14630 [Mycolicibacterium fortuitum]|uniref:Pyridine nucleotide-disulfide oxidoreductase n=1 Tax=Mycolicibacterium fortuitum TaxID=1766 RepID=A0ABD6QCD3_MYCFO|nr:FAD-dependent oxidoreductase [Mycolicibacterium fortuitum]OMC33128.1 hypothetical protein A5742_14630 [Mycolicibacterium fortuitum]